MFEWNPNGADSTSADLETRIISARPTTLHARLLSASGAEPFIM